MAGAATGRPGSPRVAGAGRYELRGVIGGGRTGVVHRAYDRDLGRIVALKALRTHDADALYRLKREFRALARLAHPNLVPFFDLFVEGDERFFTMELIDGVDFVESFRCRLLDDVEPADVHGELRGAIVQLAAGLDALHRQGVLHRDVKPANVLLADDGRLVLLDFGLAAGIATPDEDAGDAAGTMGYLAPEQIAGRPASGATDWYSAGVMLYEVLTGHLPFEGPALLDVLAGRAAEPVAPRLLDPTVPPDLDALVMALLAHDPERRPLGSDVVDRLARDPDAVRVFGPEPAPHAQAGRFVGRDLELGELFAALRKSRSAPFTFEIVGASGIGKSALLEEFAARARRTEGALVLSARCHPQEAIPFKAMDGVIDDLARHLARLPDAAIAHLLPDQIAAARRIFPVLGRVDRIARAIDTGGTDLDPMQGRRRAFHALRELIARLAAEQPVVLWIDDLQWGDLDSAALLRELRRAPDPPAVLLLLSFRAEAHVTSPALDALRGEAGAVGTWQEQALELGPLGRDDAARLIGEVLAATAEVDDAEVRRIAAESQGSPLFAVELARHLAARSGLDARGASPLGIDEVVATRVAGLPVLAREVLDLVAAAGRPLDRELTQHARIKGVDLRPALALLRAQCLVRAVPSGDRVATATYHDRIRETVLGMLPDEARRALHRALAGALEATADADPRLLVDHYEQAGEAARAGELALASGRSAAADLAFNQAAELYARALELGAASLPRWVLEARIGAMLTYAGRASEGAARYDAAATALHELQPDDPRHIAMRRRAAELYLRAGLYPEGLVALRRALRDAGVRYAHTPTAALWSILVHRVKLRLRRGLTGPGTASVGDHERLEIYWSAGVGLSLFDMVRATDFQLRHALLAFRVGEPRHLARALATEAMTLAWEGGARNRRRSALIQADATRFAGAVGNPRIEVQTLVARAAIAFVERRLREALALCEQGARLCRERHVGTTWEIANLELCAVSTLACLGEMTQLRSRLRELQQQAQERGDLYSAVSLRTGVPNLCWLAGDDPDEARRQIASARQAAVLAPFQEYCTVYAEGQIDLYAGEPRQGWGRTSASWPVFRRSYLLRVQGVRIDLRELRARCALATLASGHTGRSERARLMRHVGRAAWLLGREGVAWTAPLVATLRAGLAWQRGDRATGIILLGEAVRGFAELDMCMHAAAARLHLAAAGVGETVEHCAEVMRAHGAVDPSRLAATLLPGIAPPG